MDEKLAVLKMQMEQAEMTFIRKLGKLRYLNHLRKTNEVENCPVCTSKPEHKVFIVSDKMQNAKVSLILFNYFSM